MAILRRKMKETDASTGLSIQQLVEGPQILSGPGAIPSPFFTKMKMMSFLQAMVRLLLRRRQEVKRKSFSFSFLTFICLIERRRGLFGWFLAILSGVLFTSNNFFVKYYDIDALEMLLVRSALQTILMAIIIIVSKRKFLPEKRQDKVLTIVQVINSSW